MAPIWEWGNQLIISIQAVHNPVLDGFFNAVIFLGEWRRVVAVQAGQPGLTLQNSIFYVNFLV
ncbi:MAG: hypothetical protein JW953_07485 [Anaerolineae bacterium]|nr:hypothetical protein [Anaerolineae bacterium]